MTNIELMKLMVRNLQLHYISDHLGAPHFLPVDYPISVLENAWNPKIWPVSWSYNCARRRKIHRLWPKYNGFWRYSRFISMPHCRLLFPGILHRMPTSPKLGQFCQVKTASRLRKSTDSGQNWINSNGSHDKNHKNQSEVNLMSSSWDMVSNHTLGDIGNWY